MTAPKKNTVGIVTTLIVLLALVCGLAWLSVNTATLLKQQSDEVANNYTPRSEIIDSLQRLLAFQQHQLYRFYINNDPATIASSRRLKSEVDQKVEALNQLVNEPSLLTDLNYEIRRHRRIMDRIETLLNEADTPAVVRQGGDSELEKLFDDVHLLIEGISLKLESLQLETYSLTEQNADKAVVEVEQLSNMLLIFAILIVVTTGVAMRTLYSRQQDRDKLYRVAYTDSLTGLPNYRVLQQRLQSAPSGTLISIKTERLSVITATYGYSAATDLLQQVTAWIQAQLVAAGSDGELFRYHDDGWAILTPSKDEDDSRLLKAVASIDKEPFLLNDKLITVVLKAGITQFPEDGDSAEQLLRNADAAILAITEKRSAFHHYTPALPAEAQQWLAMESGLHRALKNDELELHYQAKMTTQKGDLVGAEALLRWRHNGQMISPGMFIPVAEECGLIVPIGTWVIEQACRQLAMWRSQGLTLFPIAVNISAQQFQQDNFFDIVTSALARLRLDSRLLELEITEAVAATNPQRVIETMQRLREAGVRLAIDDFGTGYSSLTYLQRLPVDTIKIDRSFVTDINTNSDNAAIVDMILTLADKKDLTVVAEGVETNDEWRVLRRKSCDQVQGFLFARPEPVADFHKRLIDASPLPSDE